MTASRIRSAIAWGVVGGLWVGLWLAGSQPARAATATASATASVVPAISITKTADLRFGNLSSSATAGTVVIDTAGARTATGGVTLQGGAAVGAASFTVSGGANSTYAITLPTSITVTDGTNTMTVNTFTSNPSGTGTLDGTGNQTLTVGATLQVGANQPNGSYTGTFDVTVDYN